ncbi:RNA polymerase sigma-70 factor [Pedobacter chinensis]|uniref:RNA polymerase sigma-70 factor n=1 Tax=Pedobacter chinensis TaxID=2282421 RepID=A0A369PX18_9SPHI|nr:RNA polymerase sigma-70 factor [Pedobacter chinensis]RDC55266.1 RNA polymerase sigma-70 factor [Pedobacter chinensis]
MARYRTHTDQELAALLKTGDHEAYAEIYNRYIKLLYAFALKRLDDEQEVEDLLHELFMSFWSKREQFNEDTLLAPYLYSAVRYRIINIFSRRKVSAQYLDSFNTYLDNDLSTDETDHLIRHNELSAQIDKEIEALPKKMREVFQLSRKNGYTRKQIADELGLSEETVKSHMFHALRILKVKLKP